jgi:acyl carrier protein
MENSNDIQGRLRRTLSEVFEVDEQSLPANPTQQSVEQWDSLGHLQLIIAVEQEFNVRFLTERIPKMITLELLEKEVIGELSRSGT